MIFYIYNFFRDQKIDEIGQNAIYLQLSIIFKMIIIIFMNSFYYKYLPWFLYISFCCDVITMIFGFFSSYKRISILLFIFFLLSLVLFLFDFIPLIIMNSKIWNDTGSQITASDIFQSICEILFFSSKILTLHFARKQRALIEQQSDNNESNENINNEQNQQNQQTPNGNEETHCNINNINQLSNKLNSEKDNIIKSSLFICADGFQDQSSNDINNNQHHFISIDTSNLKQEQSNDFKKDSNKNDDNEIKIIEEQQVEQQQPTSSIVQQQQQQEQSENIDIDNFISIDLSDSNNK